jgi:hypothetical protein
MRLCLRSTVAGLLALSTLMVCAGSVSAEPRLRGRTSVRVDQRGHLVRSAVVRSQPIAPKVIEPQPVPAVEIPDATLPVAPDAKVDEIVEAAAKQYDVDPLLVHSVIQVESNYNVNAVSPKGAQGVMQLIPATARRFGATNAFDPKDNIEAGVKYLKYLNSLFPDDLQLTLAAYNAGEGAVMKYGNNIPPYRETQQYVENVGKRYGSARRAAEKKKASGKALAPKTPPEEVHPPVEAFVDSEGRLSMRTKPPEAVSTP